MIEIAIITSIIWICSLAFAYDIGRHNGWMNGFEEADDMWRTVAWEPIKRDITSSGEGDDSE